MIIINENTKKQVKKKNSRKYQCPYCNTRLPKERLITHIESSHEDMIPQGYTAARIVFNMINKKECGHCVVCKSETEWDENTWKYKRFCSKECSEKYSKEMKQRMIDKYGKEHLLNDPEKQKEMLSKRSISGTYKFSDGGKRNYCGTYEKKLLEFFDKVLNVNSMDIMTPGPTIEYVYNGKKLFWITDLYYLPANLVFDVKDGGDNPNNRQMEEYREKQIVKEDTIKQMNKYNYIRLTDNNFQQLMLLLAELKLNMLDNDNPEYIIRINEMVIGTRPTQTFICNKMMDGTFVGACACTGGEMGDWYDVLDNKLIKLNKTPVSIKEDYNSRYNDEDLHDHHSVGGLILNEYGEVLMLDHVKFDMLTIPVGKAKYYETPYQALCTEVREETNIIIDEAKEVAIFNKTENRNGKTVHLYNHVFIVTKYHGKAKNLEPNKHRDLFWMDFNDFIKLDTKSYVTSVFIDLYRKGYIDKNLNVKKIGISDSYKEMKYVTTNNLYNKNNQGTIENENCEYHIFKYKGDSSDFVNFLESNVGKTVEFNKEFFYEKLTGKELLTPDQIIYDESFEEIESEIYDYTNYTSIFEASVEMFNVPSIPILDFDKQEKFKNKYPNLELRFNWNGYFAKNINTQNTTPYVESVSLLDDEMLKTLNNF